MGSSGRIQKWLQSGLIAPVRYQKQEKIKLMYPYMVRGAHLLVKENWYRSGYKGIGNIHTSVPEADVWVMEDYSPSTTIEIQTSVGLEEIKRRSIFELCKYQS